MFKDYFFFIFGLICFGSTAQIINIPDANLKSTLLLASPFNAIAEDINGDRIAIDTNGNNEIEVSEALTVYYLDVSNRSIAAAAGLEHFTNLVSLNISENQLSSFDPQPIALLQELDVSENAITSLDISNLLELKSIRCNDNMLSILNVSGATSLETINSRNNSIGSLNTTALVNLVSIDMRNNELTQLNLLNASNLDYLDASENNLTSVEFNNLALLTYANVGDNMLTSLDLNGLPELEFFYCYNNQLTELDLSQCPFINFLDISENLIETIDLSAQPMLESFRSEPGNLIALDVQANHDLLFLNIRDNNLIQLFIKNGQTNMPDIGLNPNLQFICVDEGDERMWIENQVNIHGYTNCVIGTYCSFVPGGEYFTFEGNVNFDSNTNGCDALDPAVPFFALDVTTAGVTNTFIGDASGGYSIPVVAGTHTVTPVLENPTYFTISPTSITASFPADPSPVLQDFCLTANGEHPDLEVVIIPTTVARPGFEAEYRIQYSNKGTETQSGEVDFTYNDSFTEFLSAIPAEDAQNANILTWNYTNLEPFETRHIDVVFEVNSPMDTPPINNGDELGYQAIIYPVAGDDLPEDNAFELKQIVVGSEDPNDKTCLQGDSVLPEFAGEYAHYLIRFENIGTFAATNVVITDVIDESRFLLDTFQVLGGSHDFFTRIVDNQVEFIFENINLPFDDPNNDGYVIFKIRTRSDLVEGDQFANRASIYFDYNFPIVTNSYVTVLEENLGVADFAFAEAFVLYPNPARDMLNIHSKRDLAIEQLVVYNVFGQMVLSVLGASEEIPVDKLSAGVYFIKISTSEGSSFSEFIKE